MKTANVATTRNELSRLLRRVKRGETVVITDRNRPVARLLPIAPADNPADADLAALVASGVLTPPAGPPLDVARFLAPLSSGAPLPADRSLASAVLADREESL
jgi:prevent-host-death family protein